MGCRKNLNKLTPAERTAFVNAFIQLMDDGTTDKYSQIHSGAGVHGHGGPAFVAWHREFVRRFELDLQAVDSSVSLPYWDWTSANINSAGTLSMIWRDDFLGGSGDNAGGGAPTGPNGGYPITSGPFAGRFTRKPFDIFSFPGTGGQIASFMASPDFGVFRQIEFPHGSAHVFIGGEPQSFTLTAGTPDFWLIHSNVDRLWAEWIRQHEGTPGFEPFKPASGGPTGHNLGDSMWPWNGTSIPFGVLPWVNSPEIVRPQDLLDHLALGYQYDTIDSCPIKLIERPTKSLTEGDVFKGILPKEFLPKERLPKEFRPKELRPKELQPKEFLPKEFQPKELQPKELSPKEIREGSLFIDPRLRPDLVGAGLAFEPDISDADLAVLRNELITRRANLLRN